MSKKFHLLIRILAWIALEGCSTRIPGLPGDRIPSQLGRPSAPVGTMKVRFEDTTRDRPLVTRLWYPADPKTESNLTTLDWIFVAWAVPEAPFAAHPERLPLVMLSHVDHDPKVDRQAVHEQVGKLVVHFFDTNLR